MVAKFENINKTFCTSAGTFNWNEKTSVNLNKGEILLITGKSEYVKKTVLTLMRTNRFLGQTKWRVYNEKTKGIGKNWQSHCHFKSRLPI